MFTAFRVVNPENKQSAQYYGAYGSEEPDGVVSEKQWSAQVHVSSPFVIRREFLSLIVALKNKIVNIIHVVLGCGCRPYLLSLLPER